MFLLQFWCAETSRRVDSEGNDKSLWKMCNNIEYTYALRAYPTHLVVRLPFMMGRSTLHVSFKDLTRMMLTMTKIHSNTFIIQRSLHKMPTIRLLAGKKRKEK